MRVTRGLGVFKNLQFEPFCYATYNFKECEPHFQGQNDSCSIPHPNSIDCTQLHKSAANPFPLDVTGKRLKTTSILMVATLQYTTYSLKQYKVNKNWFYSYSHFVLSSGKLRSIMIILQLFFFHFLFKDLCLCKNE